MVLEKTPVQKFHKLFPYLPSLASRVHPALQLLKESYCFNPRRSTIYLRRVHGTRPYMATSFASGPTRNLRLKNFHSSSKLRRPRSPFAKMTPRGSQVGMAVPAEDQHSSLHPTYLLWCGRILPSIQSRSPPNPRIRHL